jgi:hypothetical protein
MSAQVFRPARIFVSEGPEKRDQDTSTPHHRLPPRRPGGSCGRAVGDAEERSAVVQGVEGRDADATVERAVPGQHRIRGDVHHEGRERTRQDQHLRQVCVVDGKETRCGAGGSRGEAVTFSAVQGVPRPRGVGVREPWPLHVGQGAAARAVEGSHDLLLTPEWGPGRAESWGGRPAAAPSPSLWGLSPGLSREGTDPVRLCCSVASLGTGPCGASPLRLSGRPSARPG